MALRHVVWDWNGTLFDDVEVCYRATCDLFAEYGKDIMSFDMYRDTIRHPVRAWLLEWGFPVENDDELLHEMTYRFHLMYVRHRPTCGLREGAERALKAIQDGGLSQSVLSAHPQKLLDEIIELHNLGGFFSAVVGASDHLSHGKVAAGEAWLSKASLQPDEIVVVGDMDHDAEVAERLGAHCVLITAGLQSPKRLAQCGGLKVPSIAEAVSTILRRP